MAKEKKPVHKVQMTEAKRNIIRRLLEEYDIETAEDIQDALKDLLGGTIKEMMEAERSKHLGYEKSERTEHTGEDVGLYNTVVTREDYENMAEQVALSMNYGEGNAGQSKGEPERKTPAADKNSSRKNAYSPILNSEFKKSAPPADFSNIRAGSIVVHKAFGKGRVEGIDGNILVVLFNGDKKKFQFSAAFEQRFLEALQPSTAIKADFKQRLFHFRTMSGRGIIRVFLKRSSFGFCAAFWFV